MSNNKFILLAAVCALAACQPLNGAGGGMWGSSDAGVPASGAVLAPADVVTLRLAEAAEKAATALDNISRVEQAQKGPVMAEDFSAAPPELQEPVTITWSGPVERFLQAMARRAGYTFRTQGNKPAAPVTVNIDDYQQPLIKVVRNASLQVTGKADVVLDASNRVIELRYAPSAVGQM